MTDLFWNELFAEFDVEDLIQSSQKWISSSFTSFCLYPEGWGVKVQPLLYLRNSPSRWQLELVCKVDEIIFLHLQLGQDVNCPICKGNCFNRPTVRREEDDPICIFVDVPCFKVLANSCDTVNSEGKLWIMWTRMFSHHRIKKLSIHMTELRCKLAMETYRLDCQQNIYLINYAAEGGCGSWFCFGLFFLCFFSFVSEQTQTPTRPIVVTGWCYHQPITGHFSALFVISPHRRVLSS